MLLSEMITDLCSLPAPSGFEEMAFVQVKELLAPYVDEFRTDAMDNLIAVKRSGVHGAKSLLLNAHMDEIGLIVTGYEKGFLRFARIGGVDPRMLAARELRIMTDPPLFGVIGSMPPHTLSGDEREKAFDPDKLFIDIGFSEEETKRRVPLGTPVVFADGCSVFSENHICGKSLDDRACVAILIKVMENLKHERLNTDVFLLISTQEELGMRGAAAGAFSIEPDLAVAVDVTHAATPDSKKSETMEQGRGAAIAVGPNMSRMVSDKLFEIARNKKIAHQTEVESGNSGTDAWAIQVSRCGIPTGVVSLPVKYMHTPVEMMELSDAEAIVKLLTEFVISLSMEVYHD